MTIRSDPPPDLTVVIPTYQRPEGCRAAIASVMALISDGRLSAEVIVVEQGDTPSYDPELDQGVTWLFSTHRGVSHARNAGLRLAAADTVLFLDDDAQLRPVVIDVLEQHRHERRAVTAAGIDFGPEEQRRFAPDSVRPLTAGNTFRYFIEFSTLWDVALLRSAGGFDERLGQPLDLGAEEGPAALARINLEVRRWFRPDSRRIVATPELITSHPAPSLPQTDKAARYGAGAGSLLALQPSWWIARYWATIATRRTLGLLAALVSRDHDYAVVRRAWLRGFVGGVFTGLSRRRHLRVTDHEFRVVSST